jgi:hypothetical protein
MSENLLSVEPILDSYKYMVNEILRFNIKRVRIRNLLFLDGCE